MARCTRCGEVLTDNNWYASLQRVNRHLCKACRHDAGVKWRAANPEKRHEYWKTTRRKNGHTSMHENRECSSFLGVHVAEEVLYRVFKDVTRMPYGNHGYDFVCNNGYKIDAKSSCIYVQGSRSPIWSFHIDKNQIADYFVLLAFTNREDIEPLHIWLIPGNNVNDHVSISISESTIGKWDEFRLDINKVLECCDMMRGHDDIL